MFDLTLFFETMVEYLPKNICYFCACKVGFLGKSALNQIE